MLIGPCRYSIARYDSAQNWAASRSFRAASSASPNVQPAPRNETCSTRRGSSGSGASSARSASPAMRPASAPSDARRSARVVVAKRVCTTDSSSAKSRTSARRAAAGAGVPATAVITSESLPAGSRSRSCTTSVVVPERQMASTKG